MTAPRAGTSVEADPHAQLYMTRGMEYLVQEVTEYVLDLSDEVVQVCHQITQYCSGWCVWHAVRECICILRSIRILALPNEVDKVCHQFQ